MWREGEGKRGRGRIVQVWGAHCAREDTKGCDIGQKISAISAPGDVTDRAYEEGERPKSAVKELDIEPDLGDPGPWPRSQK